MDSTVVGSFPLKDTAVNFERALIDQVEVGVTIPCYPQLVDMIEQFYKPLSELIDNIYFKDGEFHLIGDLDFPKEPIALEYGKKAMEIIDAHAELKARIHGLKACFTGPFTLCANLILDDEDRARGLRPLLFREPRAHLLGEFVERVARYVAKITQCYRDMGFKIVSIDDPFLCQMVGRRRVLFHDADFIIKMINIASKYLKDTGSLHVCGILSPKLRDILLETEIRYLDHEFKTCPDNFELFDKKILEAHNKILAFGTIKTNPVPERDKDPRSCVENINEIAMHLKKAKERFGEENLIIKPDCGFSGMRAFDALEDGLGYQLTLEKLRNMNLAIKQVFG
ncbi:MAG: hypothetical protein ACTSWN_14870 [Promethearchaeota archaeon]